MQLKKKGISKLWNVKNAYYGGTTLSVGGAFFIDPLFILVLFGYAFFRFVSFLFDFEAYEKWKWEKFAQSDAKLTYRKLLYLLQKCEAYDLEHVKVYNRYTNEFRAAFLQVDDYTRIELTLNPDTSKYKAKLYFQWYDVDASEGYSFQGIKWDTSKYPELHKTLSKFFSRVEENIKQREEEATKAKKKSKIKEQVQTKEHEKMLAKKIRQAYKKDMSI